MMNSAKYYDLVLKKLTYLSQLIEAKGSIGLTDLNKHCENFILKILNIIFQSNLMNLNNGKQQYPGLDLGDFDNRIAYQVTSDKSSKKINDTLRKVITHEQYKYFNKINVFILSFKKQKSYTIKVDTLPFFEFTESNILDFSNIIREFSRLELDTQRTLSQFIDSEVSHFDNTIDSSEQAKFITKTFTKDHNVFVVISDGTTKQLTFSNSDQSPLLVNSLKKIIFLRGEEKSYFQRKYFCYKILSVDINTLEEQILADQKPYFDGQDGSFELLNPKNLVISKDEKYLYFIIEKYATGSQFAKLNLNTGQWIDLFSAESFEIIYSETNEEFFLVGSSEIRSRGRDIYYKLCDQTGRSIKEFANKDEFMKFRSDIMGQNYVSFKI